MSRTLPTTRARVTIVIAAYNAESYLGDTLESVARQTYGAFEAIVVDDGSTDGTRSVAEQFVRRDSRFRVITQPNSGVSAARNRAMAAGTGEFLALLDADDLWMPEYLATQLPLFDDAWRPIDVLSANAVNLGGSMNGRLYRDVERRLHPVSLLDLIAVEDCVCIMTIFRRSVYERIGGFDESLRRNEDYDYWLRAAAGGFAIVFNGMPLGCYRRRPDCMSADEEKMLAGVQVPLKKVRATVAADSREAEIIDRQLRRFEAARLMVEAKAALTRGDLGAARHHLRRLSEQSGRLGHQILSTLAAVTPSLLAWGYSTKLRFRALRA